MIYLKKPDGKIEQFKDDMKQALQLDKELFEQRGEEFGEIYDADSLPDEDKIKVGLMTQKEYDAKQTEAGNSKIKAELYEIDFKSIRSIREWIATQVDTPEYLKQYEAEAIEKRGKLK